MVKVASKKPKLTSTASLLGGVNVRHRIAAVAAAAFVFSFGAYAQTFTGSISGRVVDPQGAAVANATVTASEPSKNIETTAKTGDSGDFSFSSLQPGNY